MTCLITFALTGWPGAMVEYLKAAPASPVQRAVRTQQRLSTATNFQIGRAPLLIHGTPGELVMNPQRMPEAKNLPAPQFAGRVLSTRDQDC